MTSLRLLATLAVLLGVVDAPAFAAEPGSPACKRELVATQNKMQESLALLDSVQNAPAPQKCEAYSRHLTLAGEIRESFARCKPADVRSESVRDADDVVDATRDAYNKWCPPRPGMVRVHMTEVTHIMRDQLPKPLAAVHRCGEGPEGPMTTFNERFDLGRLVVLGCPGNPNPTAEEAATRNIRSELLKKEQAYVYITRDMDGDDPRRLRFPILAADGRETVIDQLLPGRILPGDKRDEILAFWEPASDSVCRIRAVWRVADAKANLVLWQEATDCSGRAEFKTVLDRR
jgi:hypothetical protein